MKILNIKIFDDKNVLIRDTSFQKNKLFLVYGNVKQPKDNKNTINSVGKTLFLMICNQLYGLTAKKGSELCKKVVSNYHIEAVVEDNHGTPHNIIKTFNKNVYSVDNKEISLKDYLILFELDRKLLSRQILTNPNGSLLGYNRTATQSDYVDFLSILNLKDLSNDVNRYYSLREDIKKLTSSKNNLLVNLKINDSQFNSELSKNIKDISEIEQKLKNTKSRVSELKLTEESLSKQKLYTSYNRELKNLEYKLSRILIEKEGLVKFMHDCKNKNPSVSYIEKLYSEANYELPEMVVKKLQEVYDFYKAVIEDRVSIINKRIDEIERYKNELTTRESEIRDTMNILGNELATNDLYISAIDTIQKLNLELSQLKFRQGELSQLEKISKTLSETNLSIIKLYNDINEKVNGNKDKILKYENFVLTLLKDIYKNDIKGSFNIYCLNKYRKDAIPIHIDMSISGETGEGIFEVEKIIICIMMFYFNEKSNILILDSSCFNGIDPRQVSGLLTFINSICETKSKQAIISINKYQLINNYVSDKKDSVLELSEFNKLFKISY